jgi:type IV fimbrial biogenesis protein FimT
MKCVISQRRSVFGARNLARCVGSRGFTLLELMMVIGIAGILAAIALPAMRTFVQNQRESSAAGALVYSLSYGRSEAIKEDLSTAGVVVCASSTSTSCDPAGNWNNGWIVLPPVIPPAVTAAPLQVVGALPAGLTLKAITSGGVPTPSVSFVSTGQTSVANTQGNFVAFTLCDSRGAAFAREVEINPTGHVQAATSPGFEVDGKTVLTCP